MRSGSIADWAGPMGIGPDDLASRLGFLVLAAGEAHGIAHLLNEVASALPDATLHESTSAAERSLGEAFEVLHEAYRVAQREVG